MGERKLDELRDHFDGADLSDAIDSATWEADVESDPMIVTSVRLPKSLLDWVRQQASDEHVKPTTLMRQWIEERRDAAAVGAASGDASVARLADRVSVLETFALRVVTGDGVDGATSMAGLLAALEASVDAAEPSSIPTLRIKSAAVRDAIHNGPHAAASAAEPGRRHPAEAAAAYRRPS